MKPGPLEITIFDNAGSFGGHQIMLMHALDGMLQSEAIKHVHFIYYKGNKALKTHLISLSKTTGKLELHTCGSASSRAQALFNYFQGRRINKLAKRFRSLHSDIVLIAQGDIQQASEGLLAAKKARIPCVSYIPLTLSYQAMGAKLGWLRDILAKPLFRKPDAFILAGHEQKTEIEAKGATAPMFIAENGIDLDRLEREAKELPNMSIKPKQPERKLLGMVGRIEFKQKGHDRILQAFHALQELQAAYELVVVGEGPDRKRLEDMAKEYKVLANIHFIPWQTPIAPIYKSIDILLAASNYETHGIAPLVTIESLYLGIPNVVTTCCKSLKEIPDPWVFDNNAPQSLLAALKVAERCPREYLEKIHKAIRQRASLEKFQEKFISSLQKSARA